jgi:yecA family protein
MDKIIGLRLPVSTVEGHNHHMSQPDYRTIESRLDESRALTDLPEAHGTLAGAFCASNAVALQDWLREVFPEGVAGAAEGEMHAVFEWTRHVLGNGQMEFALLLPADDRPIEERAAALGEWCQGFLYGLGSTPIPDIDSLSPEVAEIVRDLTAITQLSVDEAESEQNNEEALEELIEFVRVGVQLLFDELAPFRDATTGGGGPDGPVSLH